MTNYLPPESYTVPPMRLGCGYRHYGVVCLDGKVMCCNCFQRFNPSDLAVDRDGKKINICQLCAYQHIPDTLTSRGEPS